MVNQFWGHLGITVDYILKFVSGYIKRANSYAFKKGFNSAKQFEFDMVVIGKVAKGKGICAA